MITSTRYSSIFQEFSILSCPHLNDFIKGSSFIEKDYLNIIDKKLFGLEKKYILGKFRFRPVMNKKQIKITDSDKSNIKEAIRYLRNIDESDIKYIQCTAWYYLSCLHSQLSEYKKAEEYLRKIQKIKVKKHTKNRKEIINTQDKIPQLLKSIDEARKWDRIINTINTIKGLLIAILVTTIATIIYEILKSLII